MNEQLQSTVNEILTQSMEAFNKGADWLSGEIPDVVNQLLVWHMIESILANAILIMILITSIVSAIKIPRMARAARKNNEVWTRCYEGSVMPSTSYDAAVAAPYFILFVVSVIAIMSYSVGDMFVWLQILVAPKLYLLEYSIELIK